MVHFVHNCKIKSFSCNILPCTKTHGISVAGPFPKQSIQWVGTGSDITKNCLLLKQVNQDEFVALVNQHRPMLFKVCNLYCRHEHERQDLFQEIVIQLWRAYPGFRGESKFSTWLYRIALNTAISDLRKKKTHIISTEPEGLPDGIDDIQNYQEKEEKLKQLYSAINQLTEIEKAIVMLYLEDRSYDEMEDILGINQNNLRVKMNRIKDKLRKLTKAVEYGS